jgi:hypothetical protein
MHLNKTKSQKIFCVLISSNLAKGKVILVPKVAAWLEITNFYLIFLAFFCYGACGS